jgi:transposase InsO family protein
VDQICGGCLAGKHRRSLFPHRAEYRAEEVLELVHGDLCGPITPPAPSGSRYFLLLIDNNNRYMWLRTLRSKDQVAVAIKQFQQVAEAETGRKLRVFQSDHGGKFTSVEFVEYCVEQGLHHQLMAPYSPQQNGVVERRNQMVVGMACFTQPNQFYKPLQMNQPPMPVQVPRSKFPTQRPNFQAQRLSFQTQRPQQ